MSDIKATDPNEQVHEDKIVAEEQVEGDASQEGSEMVEPNEGNAMPSSEQEEEVIKKKYGGIIPKKPPLISKDHERAFFDSADWALGKQGVAKPKGPLEALRPKLQPTQQQVRSRRSAYASTETDEAENAAPEDVANKE
ncbi:Endosulphine protein [Dioscorea alata]|uniref:Endosulphine protein n=1 Tax=Dioscorea alata TaxID=55571 RepID=A0ACB7WDA2_DIOAL|nr:Endosulphine protein [Dioscorea alata]